MLAPVALTPPAPGKNFASVRREAEGSGGGRMTGSRHIWRRRLVAPACVQLLEVLSPLGLGTALAKPAPPNPHGPPVSPQHQLAPNDLAAIDASRWIVQLAEPSVAAHVKPATGHLQAWAPGALAYQAHLGDSQRVRGDPRPDRQGGNGRPPRLNGAEWYVGEDVEGRGRRRPASARRQSGHPGRPLPARHVQALSQIPFLLSRSGFPIVPSSPRRRGIPWVVPSVGSLTRSGIGIAAQLAALLRSLGAPV